jgi:hypothetical protein
MRDYNIANHMPRNETVSQTATSVHEQMLIQQQQQQQHAAYTSSFMNTHNPYQTYLTTNLVHQTRHHDMYSLNAQVMDNHVLPSSIGTSVPTSSSLNPILYPDYLLKYEKPEENNYANCVANDNNRDNTDTHVSYNTPYGSETKEKLYIRGNSMLDSYGNSVFDSPLSLATSNDENNLITTLTASRDYSRIQITSNSSNSLKKSSSGDSNLDSRQEQLHKHASHKHDHFEQLKPPKTAGSKSLKTTDPQASNPPNPKQSKSNHGSVLNDYELITLPLRELNKRLRYMPKPAAIDLKKRRRTLKNRKYAQNCRSKRLEQKCEIEVQNIRLKAEISRLQKVIDATHKEKCLYKAYIEQIEKDHSNLGLTQSVLETLNANKMALSETHASFFSEMNNASPSSSVCASSFKSTSSSSSSTGSLQDINF